MGKTTFIDGNKTIIDTDYYIKLLGCENKNKELQSRINSLEKRLRHLLESDTISLFDEVNPKTLEYKYDISMFDKDYTSIMFANIVKENKELNKKLDKCIPTSEAVESIRRKNEHIAKIQQENVELRRQLKDIQEAYCKSSQLNHRKSIEIFKMKHQQKEFIKYLENLLITKRQKANTVRAYERTVIPIQGILIKFKEIIGVENEK